MADRKFWSFAEQAQTPSDTTAVWAYMYDGAQAAASDRDRKIRLDHLLAASPGNAATWARSVNPSGTVPLARLLGNTLVSSLETLSGATRLAGSSIKSLIPAINAETGTITPARLATGTTGSGYYLQGDGTWAVPPGVTPLTSIDARISTWARAFSPSGFTPITRGGTGAGTKSQARTNLGLGSAAIYTVGTAITQLASLDVGGRFVPARLGSGTASSSVFLRGDGVWASTGSGGLTTTQVDARIATWALAVSASGIAPIARGGTGAGTAQGARSSLGLGNAATFTVGALAGHLAIIGVGGQFAVTRLGSGVASSSKYLRGDGSWQVPPAPSSSGLTATQVDARVATWAVVNSPSGVAPIARGGTNSGFASGARTNLGLGSAALATIGTIANTVPVLGSGGRYAPVRLGSGTPSHVNWLRGDGVWSQLPVGLTLQQIDARVATWARTSSPSGNIPITSGGTGASSVLQARINFGLKSAALLYAGVSENDLAVLGPGGRFATGRLGSGVAVDHQTLTYRAGSGRWEYLASSADLKRITKIPSSFDEQLLYLTHNERDVNTVPVNATLTPGVIDRSGGEFYGWSRDGNGYLATGALAPDNIPVEVIGGDVGSSTGEGNNRVVVNWSIEFIGSRNRDFRSHWPIIVIAGISYYLSPPVWSASLGLWVFEVGSGPPAFSGNKSINFLTSQASDGSYLSSTGTTIIRQAGLWNWDGASYNRLVGSDFEPQFRALAGQASGEGWGFARDWFRHKSAWIGSDLTHRLLGIAIAPEDTSKTWAVTRSSDGAIRLRSSQSEYRDLTGATFDPDGLALALAAEPVSVFDSSVVQGWTDPNVMATPGLWASHTRTSADDTSGSVTFIEGNKTNAFSLGYRHVQRLPPSIVVGTADGYLCRLNFSTANGIYLYLGLVSSEGGGVAGPNLVESVRTSLGIAVRAANGTVGKWRISSLSNDSPSEPYRWTGASIPSALVNALKAANAQVVLVDISNTNVNWDNLTFGGVTSETQGVGVNNALILQNRRLRVWRGENEVNIKVGTELGANYQLPVLADSDHWVGLDASTTTLYALRVGAELYLARLLYSSIAQPAHSGTSQQLRAVITAGPATGKVWDSDVSGVGTIAAGSDLRLTAGLIIGSLEMLPKPQGVNEILRMEITSGGEQELDLDAGTPVGSFTGDNELKAGLNVSKVQVRNIDPSGNQYIQMGLNRRPSQSESFGGWRTTAGEGLGKAFYLVNPDGTYVELLTSAAYSSGSSWCNIATGTQTTVQSYTPGGKFTLICADPGGLTPNTAFILKRNAASTEAVTAWITHEATHSFYYVSPTGVITEMLLSMDTPSAEHLYWLVANGPVRPAANAVFKILIALKGGITVAPIPATIEAPSTITDTLLIVPKGTGATAQPDGVPVAMSVRDNRLSILYNRGGVARFNIGGTVVTRVVAEDIDINQHVDPATPSTLIMSDRSLLHQASDYVRQWELVLGGGGVGSGVGGGGATGASTETSDGRVRQIFLARSAVKPDNPHYTYVGGAVGYSPPVTSTNVWQKVDPDDMSSLPLWMATAESVRHASGGGWVTGAWTVVKLTSFFVQYSRDFNLSGEWHAPPLVSQDGWMRLRDSNGQWGPPLRITKTSEINPWTPLLYSTYIAGASLDSVHQIWRIINLYGRSELMFRVKMFDEFVPGTTTDEPLNEIGISRAVWSKMSASQPWPFAPSGNTDPSNNPPVKDQYAFRLQAHIRNGLSLSLGSDAAPDGDVWKEQLTFWVRFVHSKSTEVSGNYDVVDQMQIFGFGSTYNRGFLDISMR